MAFELNDFHRQYTKLGSMRALYNASRADEPGGENYYAFQNEVGSYVIMQETTSGTTKIFKYYATGPKRASVNFDTDWTNRAALTYLDYYQLFLGD